MLCCLPPPSADDAFGANAPKVPPSRQSLTGFHPELPATGDFSSAIPPVLQVLLLEDNVPLAKALQHLLTKKGHQATVAHQGQDALRLLAAHEFHVALVDIDLPDINGFNVVAQAQALGRLQKTRIIFCSGAPSAERVAQAGRFPGSIFLPKPFSSQELLIQIEQIFQRSSTGEGR